MNSFYPTSLIKQTIGKDRSTRSKKQVDKFEKNFAANDIEQKQLKLFNHTWDRARKLPFYIHWQELHGLPDSLSSIIELDGWPALTKDDLRENVELVHST